MSSTYAKKGFSLGNLFWAVLWIVLISLLVLKFFVFQQVTVVGQSMLPNYNDGELLLVNQLDKKFSRGQVVAVYADKDVARNADYFTRFSARFFLKRIIAMPNEEVEIVGGKIIIYNQENPKGAILEEVYIPEEVIESENARSFYYPKTKIPNGHYFVMGDNRSNSTDSRSPSLGPVPAYSVFGQESMRFWPFQQAEVFDLPSYQFLPPSEEIAKKREEYKKLEETVNTRTRKSPTTTY